jgi:hypothetical protein
MPVSGTFYRNVFTKAFNKEIDFDSDTIKGMLCTVTYTPDLDAHIYKSSVTNEVTGTGYTATGATLTSPTMTYTAANSWATTRANSTAYAAGAIVRPATGNGYLYQASTAGTSAASIPTYPTTIGSTVTDGSVVWTCVGKGILVLDGADLSWATSTITARYCVLYDSTPATDATRPLIALIDFGADMASTAGTFLVQFDAVGIAYVFVA